MIGPRRAFREFDQRPWGILELYAWVMVIALVLSGVVLVAKAL